MTHTSKRAPTPKPPSDRAILIRLKAIHFTSMIVHKIKQAFSRANGKIITLFHTADKFAVLNRRPPQTAFSEGRSRQKGINFFYKFLSHIR